MESMAQTTADAGLIAPDARGVGVAKAEAWEGSMNQNAWCLVSVVAPPQDVTVETKIDDEKGCRNIALLKRIRNLWFFPDGSMYVYYTPTHWRPIEKSNACEI